MLKITVSKKKIVQKILYFVCAFCLACAPNALHRFSLKADAATHSKGECVVDVASKRFLHALNADVELPMASTTKILTAIIAIEDCDLREEVVIPKEAEGVEGSSVYLRAGDVYTVEDLLYGLMLRSGNDCAETLALHHSGSIAAFARVMNRRAQRMGAEHSFFVNPHGLPNERHHTTARDLALISAHAMQNETFRKVVSCRFYEPRGWKNKNKMLFEYEGAEGVKTGFTVRAGRCLVTSAERGGMRAVCVVLSSPQMYERSAELLDEAFSRYTPVTLCEQGQKFEGMTAKNPFSYPLTESERAFVRYETQGAADEGLGLLKIYLKNDLLFSQNLYMIEE